MIKKKHLLSHAPKDLSLLLESDNFPKWRANQIYQEIIGKGTLEFEKMNLIPLNVRKWLDKKFIYPSIKILETKKSVDGTILLGLEGKDKAFFESVIIPKEQRLTACISSQSGCAMKCTFCLTGEMGLTRNLTAGEIIEQLLAIKRITDTFPNRILFMGMGEPLTNYDAISKVIDILCSSHGFDISPRRITLSTIGICQKLDLLINQYPNISLALSVGSAIPDKRKRLIPNENANPLLKIIEILKKRSIKQELTLEYTLLPTVNDSFQDAKALSALAHNLWAKINLIPFNPWPNSKYTEPNENTIDNFRKKISKDIVCTLRNPRGRDISAACGMLKMEKKC